MKDDFMFSNYLNVLFAVDNTDIKPTFILMKGLYDGLIAAGWSEVETTSVISCIEYRIDQKFIDDGFVEPTVKSYVKLLSNLKQECKNISHLLFDKFIKNNKMTISYKLTSLYK